MTSLQNVTNQWTPSEGGSAASWSAAARSEQLSKTWKWGLDPRLDAVNTSSTQDVLELSQQAIQVNGVTLPLLPTGAPPLYDASGNSKYYDARLTGLTTTLVGSLDGNRDGKVSQTELRLPKSIFDEMDQDGNGFLTVSEMSSSLMSKDLNRDLVIQPSEWTPRVSLKL